MSSPPTTLGQYQIIREIARSNDIVYEAYDALMNRRVAIKELSMPGGTSPQQQEDRINRFKREAQAAGTLNHPNIMTVYSFAEDAGRTFMAMEYLDGCTLRNEIDTKGALPVERATEIALAILEGLAHAHSKGVIHRDIKPDNIQILSDSSIKITDFGIARLTFQPNLTMDGQVFGTPSYMSPEQVVGKDIDARSDVFSVGIVLYEMLAGQKPFQGDSVVSITYAIMNREPTQPPNLKWSLWEVVRKALDKSPSMRYASAVEMAAALRASARPEVDPFAGPALYNYGNQTSQAVAPPAPPPPTYPFDPYTQQPNGAALPPVYGQQNYGQQNYVQQNPYAPAQGFVPPPPPGYTQAPYGQGQFAPPPYSGSPGQIPIYYPPPPKAPLFKPDTVIFLKKVGIAFVVLGTFFALIIVLINLLINARVEGNAQRRDAGTMETVAANINGQPLEDQIRLIKSARERVRSTESQQELDRQLADLHSKLGDQQIRANRPVEAQAQYIEASTIDPRNAEAHAKNATLIFQTARNAVDPVDRTAGWKKAGDEWQAAADAEGNKAQRENYLSQAAEMYLTYARELRGTSDPDARKSGRNALLKAQGDVTSGSDMERAIQDLLAEFN